MKNKFLLAIILIVAALTAGFVYSRKQKATVPPIENSYQENKPDAIEDNHVLINVPFTSQAPNANWSDPRQQDGCEEASILMAWLWINNKTMSKAEAEKEIIAISDFELERYGNYHDTNAADTARTMKDYYGYDKLEVKMDPTIEDIKDAMREGKVVLVPANGQRLANPNYKPPGPTTHMLVIKGFDDARGKFITNDPGTRLGDGFEFTYQNVFNAMVDYPSGDHLSQEGRPKSMISIQK